MDSGRGMVIAFFLEEIGTTDAKLMDLAEQKTVAETARTSWHSHEHIDMEMAIDQATAYRGRCEKILAALQNNQPTGRVQSGSIVLLDIGGESGRYILVEERIGTPIGQYTLISPKSPVGKAIWDKPTGVEAEVQAPGGSSSVRILEVL